MHQRFSIVDMGQQAGYPRCLRLIQNARSVSNPARTRQSTDVDQITGVDIFDRDSRHVMAADVVREFHHRTWNLNASFRHYRRDDQVKPEKFHLINSRFLADGVDAGRWGALVGEYKSLLLPGGWLQAVEVDWMFRSGHDRNGRNLPHLQAWLNEYNRAQSLFMNKNPGVALDLQRLLTAARFDRIHRQIHQIPVGGWMDAKGVCGISDAIVMKVYADIATRCDARQPHGGRRVRHARLFFFDSVQPTWKESSGARSDDPRGSKRNRNAGVTDLLPSISTLHSALGSSC